VLASPANNATGIATSLSEVVIAASETPPALLQIELVDQSGTIITGSALVATTAPAGFSSPFASTTYWLSTLPTGTILGANDTYRAFFLNYQTEPNCTAAPLNASQTEQFTTG
jgi:hypothetical protein